MSQITLIMGDFTICLKENKSLDFKIIKDDPSIGMMNKFINLFL